MGHTAAARAVADALVSLEPSIETQTVDSYKYAASIFAKVVADGYIGMVKTAPEIYRYFYDRVERAKSVPAARRFVSRFTASNLRRFVEETKPDLVVCTHAFPCGVMSEYKRQYDPGLPVVGIVTDFVVHPYWIYANVDAYAVATDTMREALVARGVARDRVVLSGIPVDARFGNWPIGIDELRARLDLPRDRKIVLVMGGGVGIGPLDRVMRALNDIDVPLCAVVIVGRNAGLERKVIAAAEHTTYPVRVFGFVDNVFDYMHASDVLLSKPGGLTSSEALAARVPMVLVKPLPGPEARNATYLVSQHAAVRPSGESDLAAHVRELLVSPQRRNAALAGIDALRHPDAARVVADRIVRLLDERER